MHKIIVALLLLSAVCARPDPFDDMDWEFLSSAETSQNLNLHFVVVKTIDENQGKLNNDEINLLVASPDDDDVEKRSAENVDDLETAAGTNVLRPLFVYRQQLAYRDRIKKGVARRPGIRPRF